MVQGQKHKGKRLKMERKSKRGKEKALVLKSRFFPMSEAAHKSKSIG